MKTGTHIPPLRDLPPGRLEERRQHLLAELTNGEQSTTPTPGYSLRPGAFPRRGIVRVAAVAVAALIIGSLLVSPWEGSPSLVERARAAIGDEPVLHIVTVQQRPFLGPIVEIDTGRVVPQARETEIWFDEGRALKKTVERHDGVVLDEVLETPQGGFTQGGPLITCAWIAAHPLEATKLRVSCNENMENGTTPRQIPERPPSLDERLAGFLDHYRAALDSGRAEVIGSDTIDGRDVTWLRFRWSAPRPEEGAPPAGARAPSVSAQEVAIDSSTYRPVRLRSEDGSWATDVSVAETLPFRAEYFTRPAQAPPGPSSGRSKESRPIELSEATALLGRTPLWLGKEWRGLRLVEVVELELVTGYGPLSERDPTIAPGIRFTYGANTGTWLDGPTIEISQAATCQMALMWRCGLPLLRDGQLQRYGFTDTGHARIGGVYVTIRSTGAAPPPAERGRSWQNEPGIDALTIARALQPVR